MPRDGKIQAMVNIFLSKIKRVWLEQRDMLQLIRIWELSRVEEMIWKVLAMFYFTCSKVNSLGKVWELGIRMISIRRLRIAKSILRLNNYVLAILVSLIGFIRIEEMALFMNYCRNLKFDEAPNYTYLKRIFRELYVKCGFEHDFIFDWTIQRYRVDRPSPSLEEEK